MRVGPHQSVWPSGRMAPDVGQALRPLAGWRQRTEQRISLPGNGVRQGALAGVFRRPAGSASPRQPWSKSKTVRHREQITEGIMRKQFLKTAVMAVAGIGLLAGSALAAPINGSIDLEGSVQMVGGDFLTATGINFLGINTGDGLDNMAEVGDGDGDFLSLVGSSATMKDFTFAAMPVSPLWSVGDYSFSLNSVTLTRGANFLILEGNGFISSKLDSDSATASNFILTTQGVGGTQFTWSSASGTAAVPEPTTMLLFGTGLVGLAAVGRRRKVN